MLRGRVVTKDKNEPVIDGMPEGERQPTSVEKQYTNELERRLRDLKAMGPADSVDRFLRGYGKAGTKRAYSANLLHFLKWLRNVKGVLLSPDAVIQDNLVCVFKSDPTDTTAKRRHTDYLSEYVNSVLVEKGSPESYRNSVASTVKRFYQSNDSPLFGDFRVSTQSLTPPPPALTAEDVRTVLKAMPLGQKLPLLMIWQSSAEINRVLSLTWGAFRDEYPLKLQFYGRKRHKKAYHTYLGRDSIIGLKLWREKWADLQGREPGQNDLIFMGKGGPMNASHLNATLKGTARALFRQGLVKNGDATAWHSHALRHSFETEGAHAKVAKEMRGFFEGHVFDISFVYNHSDTIHEEDLISAYLQIEPLVSLEPDEHTIRAEFAEREKSLLSRVEKAEALLSELKSELGVPQTAPPQSLRSGP